MFSYLLQDPVVDNKTHIFSIYSAYSLAENHGLVFCNKNVSLSILYSATHGPEKSINENQGEK